MGKDGSHQNDFLERVKKLKQSKVDEELLCSCVMAWIKVYGKHDVESLPMEADLHSKYVEIFIQQIIEVTIGKLWSNSDDLLLFLQCLASTIWLLKTKQDMNHILKNLVTECVSTKCSKYDLIGQVLTGIARNEPLAMYVQKEMFLDIYGLSKNRSDKMATVILQFLRTCMLRTKEQLPSGIVAAVLAMFDNCSAGVLSLIAAVYRKEKIAPDFAKFNARIIAVEDCSCYEDLIEMNPVAAKENIRFVFANPSEKLGASILNLLLKFPILDSDINAWIMYGKLLEVEKQRKVLSKCSLDFLIPPWRFSYDLAVIEDILEQRVNKENALTFLKAMFSREERENFENAISSGMDLSTIIGILLDNIDEKEIIIEALGVICELMVRNVVNTPDLVIKIGSYLSPDDIVPIITNEQTMMTSVMVENFDFIKNKLNIHSALIRRDFIKSLLNNGLVDNLALLVSDGSHDIIDELVLEMFDNTRLCELTETQLAKLAYGCLQETKEITGPLRIRSLIGKIKKLQLELVTPDDRYSSGKYLVDNNLIDIDSDVFPIIGVRYLSAELVHKVMSKPQILLKLTDPKYPHRSLYQFNREKENSFIIVYDTKFTVSIRIDSFHNDVLLLEFGGFQVWLVNGGELHINNEIIYVSLQKWIKFAASYSDGCVDLIVNDNKRISCKAHGTVWIIGSTSTSVVPGSTFYVKNSLSKNVQIGKGVTYVDYHGFGYHAPLINAVPKLLGMLLNTKTKEEFHDYFLVIQNLQLMDNMHCNMKSFAGLLRQIMIMKSDLLTNDVIGSVLSSVVSKDSVDWTLFRILFIDYALWSKVPELMNNVGEYLLLLFSRFPPKEDVLVRLSLAHFFIDLVIFMGISTPVIVDNIIMLAKREPQNRMSSFIIHVLNKSPHPVIEKVMEECPSLLQSVSLKYIPQLKDDLAETFLLDYAKTWRETGIDIETLFELFPYFRTMVNRPKIWIALISLLTGNCFPTIQGYRDSTIENPRLLEIIFPLINVLFTKPKDTILFETVVSTVVAIINRSDIDLVPYLDEIRDLLHLGMIKNECPTNTQRMSMPFEFTDSQDTLESSEVVEYKLPLAKEFLDANDLFFGFKSQAISDEIDKINAESRDEEWEKEPVVEYRNPTESLVYGRIVDIACKLLHQVHGGDLSKKLQQLLVFGPTNRPELCIELHQKTILKFIAGELPEEATLIFIREMLVTGIWDKKLVELYKSLCDPFVKGLISVEEKKVWCEFGKLVCIILSKMQSFDGVQFSVTAPAIFHSCLICHNKYLHTMMHLLLSEKMMKLSSQQMCGVWTSLVIAIEKIPSDKEFYFEKTVARDKLGCLAAQTEAPELTKLKELCQRIFEAYIVKHSKFRNSLKKFSKRTRVLPSWHTGMCQQSKTNAYLRRIERVAFECRFNIISQGNEQDAFRLWSILPKESTQKFQIAPSVHPISIPSLLIPFPSHIDLDNRNQYGEREKMTSKLGSEIVTHCDIPPCVDAYVSQPFMDMNAAFVRLLLGNMFTGYGVFKRCVSVDIAYGSERVPCVLIEAEKGFHIVFNASFDNDEAIALRSNKLNIIMKIFVDACASGYYGNVSLFVGHVVLSFTQADILISAPRKSHLMPNGIEIWFVRGYSLFLIFTNQKDRDSLIQKMYSMNRFPDSESCFSVSFSSKLCDIVANRCDFQEFTEAWRTRKLPTLMYLLILNFFSSRSFTFMSQYPVMPWVEKGRNMLLPMGAQEGKPNPMKKFNDSKDSPEIFAHPYMYGSLYSAPAVVYRLLLRVEPFTTMHWDLNAGPNLGDRMFTGVEAEFMNVMRSEQSVQELPPQMFVLPEMFENINHIEFPRFQGTDSSNCVLSQGIKNYVHQVAEMRHALESNELIHVWIDLIFGYKARGEEAIKALNVFYPTCYGKTVPFRTELEQENFLLQMNEFGTVPDQLFTTKHPERDTSNNSQRSVLIDMKEQFWQKLKNVEIPKTTAGKCEIVIEDGLVKLVDPFTRFKQYFTGNIHMNDGVFQWTVDDFKTCSFSSDDLLFCGVVGEGTVIIYRTKSSATARIGSLIPLSTCFIPPEFYPFSGSNVSCCVSSHLNLCCELCDNMIYTFHISSGRFIRRIECTEAMNTVLIDDSSQLIYALSQDIIEVFTINGTKITEKRELRDILTATLSGCDTPFLVTGHSDGRVRLWELNHKTCEIKYIDAITFERVTSVNPIIAMKVVQFGSGLICVNAKGEAKMIVTRGRKIQTLLGENAVGGCATCQESTDKLSACDCCGMYFCKKCLLTSKTEKICNKCRTVV